MEEEDSEINREMYELAHKWMAESNLRKLPCHISKDTDHSVWSSFGGTRRTCTGVIVALSNAILLQMYGWSPSDGSIGRPWMDST